MAEEMLFGTDVGGEKMRMVFAKPRGLEGKERVDSREGTVATTEELAFS